MNQDSMVHFLCMQGIRSSSPPVVTGICDPNKSRAQHHCIFKLGSKLMYLKLKQACLEFKITVQ